jgi:cysteine-rich repeat protein
LNRFAFALASALTLIPASSFAFAPTAEILEGEHDLTLADGRVVPYGTFSPRAIIAKPVEAKGSMASAAIASEAARAYLRSHLEELAPGVRAENFVEVSNAVHQGMRTIGYQQMHKGMAVQGGQVSFRFKKDRLFMAVTSAWPTTSERPARTVLREEAEANAVRHLREKLGIEGVAESFTGPMILPLPSALPSENSDRVVVEVKVRSRHPIALYSVYLDAKSAAPIARRQTLMFASGALKMNAPVRRPGAEREDFDAREASVVVDGSNAFADAIGSVTWPGPANAAVVLLPVGPRVEVINDAGRTASVAVSLADGASFTWDMRNNEFIDAQLSAYVSVLRVKDYTKTMAPWLDWLDGDALPTTVNIADVCNAYSDGDTINFYRAGQGCENTARLPDVVYHEFGHSLHAQLITPGAGRFDTALSEGISDFLAASMTGDPGTARGFFQDDSPLRDIDPADSEARWPENVSARDPHETGLIIGGALWDLRKALIAELGEQPGIALVNQIFVAILMRAGDIPSSYNEALAVDDDDGDLTNGTPHFCTIYDAFALHGLGGAGVHAPQLDGTTVVVGVEGANECEGSRVGSAVVKWEYRGEVDSGGTIELAEGDGNWSGALPTDRERVVVRYRVEVTLANGTAFAWPNNPGDPQYELYIGQVEPIYCTDFESDPFADGWAHAPLDNAEPDTDDWMFGEPRPTFGSGDPSSAHSGTNVIGNDLAPTEEYDGRYAREAGNIATSPSIDVTGSTHVRLHYYRWLNIEDGRADQAVIRANGEGAWANRATAMGGPRLDHRDTEWRFHDVDLSPMIVDNQIQVSFELEANGRTRFGGWNIDDFCIVRPVLRCGDGFHEGEEACDDGNAIDGDGCETSCTVTPAPVCGNNRLETGELCDDGNALNGDGCESTCVMTPVVMMPIDIPDTVDDDDCACTSARVSSFGFASWMMLAVLGGLFLFRRRS